MTETDVKQAAAPPPKIKRFNGVSDEELSTLIQESEFLSEAQLEKAKQRQTEENISLYQAIVEQDLISDENLGKLVADFLHLPFVILSKMAIPNELLRIIPESYAHQHRLIVFGKDDEGLRVATSDPSQQERLSYLTKKTGRAIRLYLATQKDIEEVLPLYKKELQKSFGELLGTLEKSPKLAANDIPVSKIVEMLIEYAFTHKASDIHIEPRERDTVVRFRIDGVLHDVLHMPKAIHPQVVSRVKVLAKLKTDEHFSPQDGKLQLRVEADDNIDVRVSIVPVIKGENVVLRLLSSRARQFSLADLGMSESDLAKVREAYTRSFGMILSTGPTGSGKTTTIYSILKILNVREKHISTIENPVEYDIEGISQIQVNPKTTLTFADGLRSILRQDPDIIFVGEIRDAETADIAINSALTGHLVLSTLHTNNAATTLPRLIDMQIEPFLVSSTVNVVIGQRLVRKICDKCRVSAITERSIIEKNIDKAIVKKYLGTTKDIRLYHGKGCAVCNLTGYIGRIGIFEVLKVTPEIQNLINQKVSSDLIQQKAIAEGMTTMLEDGLRKVQQGVTTLEEILRATKA